ncbi:Alpha,alpha-trehalose-phosphate synthase [UDP-forming] [Acidisarcina polymorpha]|uniref:Trehalose 6-phosphate phosphatase n=2 Tax=Acidisarcina polymorpha TaxID=2211140 RepID=A0A2Z5G586_9BACT|nr:Alpha,alpha-trehalose-phosphate synthase [UDP-forming] [Acidisarcina polymorpha]
MAEEKPAPWPTWRGSEWWRRLNGRGRSVLMLDYDGTLAPFVQDRLRASLYPGVADRLLALAQCSQMRLVFVSGRAARELPHLLPPSIQPEIWGSHGRERLLPDGRYQAYPLSPAQSEALHWLSRSIGERGFAQLLETKPGSLALHTRGFSLDEERQITRVAGSLFAEIEKSGFDWLPFDGGIEVRAAGCSKATAVEEILSTEPADAIVAYLGDDRTDEEAFRALSGRGLRVLVRETVRPTAADLWLKPPDELLAFLDQWWEAVSDEKSTALWNSDHQSAP